MKHTYEQIILQWLEALRKNDPNGGWVREYTIRCIETPFGWIGARGDRSVRDLIAKGKLEKSFDGKYRIVRALSKKEDSLDTFIGEGYTQYVSLSNLVGIPYEKQNSVLRSNKNDTGRMSKMF